jgi:hypothetical protein
MTDQFAAPATANGIKWADVKGSLVLVDVKNIETGIDTAFGKSDAVRADIAVLDGTSQGETYPDCLIFPKALQSQLRPRVGQKVLGRVTQGQAKAGQSAPWLLSEATDADKQIGTAYLANGFSTPAAATPAGAPPF